MIPFLKSCYLLIQKIGPAVVLCPWMMVCQPPLVAQWCRFVLLLPEVWARSLGWENSPGGGGGNPFQYSCLENSMDRRSLENYGLWGHCKVLDMTEHLAQLSTHVHEGLPTSIKIDTGLLNQRNSAELYSSVVYWHIFYSNLKHTEGAYWDQGLT